MSSIESHDREHLTANADASSGDGIALPSNSTKYVLKSLGISPNFM